jgi:argininosuccinate synthase
MSNRIVVAYLGDEQSAASIAAFSAARRSEVIAVAMDLGDGIPLNGLRDGALAAGATKCHALDVREEFLREVMLPAVRARTVSGAGPLVAELAALFLTGKLREIANIEQAAMIAPEPSDIPMGVPMKRRTAGEPASLHIRFADGVPFAVNDIHMSLSELMECIGTIAGAPAIEVLCLAYQQLDGSDEGQVLLRIENGQCSVSAVTAVL